MTAGISPSRTSDRLKLAASDAIAMSQQATSPTPPPNAAPWTRATVGLGRKLSTRINSARAPASARFSAWPYRPSAASSPGRPRRKSSFLPPAARPPDLVVVAQPAQDAGQVGDDGVVEGVVDLGPVQGDGCYAILADLGQNVVIHSSFSAHWLMTGYTHGAGVIGTPCSRAATRCRSSALRIPPR